ncbi:MAG: ATP-binding protein [Candidatus Zixiibacteriota bacterium]
MPNLAHDLFLLMSNLSHIKNRERLITVFVEAMNGFIPNLEVAFLDPTDTREFENTIDICTAKRNFGRIQILSDISQISSEFSVLFQNAVQMLAVFLEKLEQDKLLADERLNLQEMVDQRTEELRKSEERFRMLVDSSPVGICVNQGQKILFANPAMIKMAKAPSIEYVAETRLIDWIAEEYKTLAQERINAVMAGDIDPAPMEIKIVCYDGQTIDCLIKTLFIQYMGEPAGYTIVEDISEIKRLQRLEARAQRLETAGSIAGQVAHDFNNLLGPLVAYPEFIREELPYNHPAIEYLDSIEAAASRISEINQQLLTLGRRGHYNLEPLDLNHIIKQVVKDYPGVDKTFVIEILLDENLMPIKGGVSQLYRVFLNLLQNANDATNGIGSVTIKTENYYADSEQVVAGKVPRGEYVKVTVTDTGCGISEEVAQRVFDPFFTTKSSDRRRGSGLGLSIVDAVIKDHDGFIDFRSSVGRGTTFYMFFPITREHIGDGGGDSIARGSESLLVVDDDAMQRDVLCHILSRLGYAVDSVASGEEALGFLKHTQCDLVILDMIMKPGIDGAETFRRIIRKRPGQRAILVSGYSETERVLMAQELGAGEFVKKPVSKQAIALAVRRELDRMSQLDNDS